jgi:hypothetical protein
MNMADFIEVQQTPTLKRNQGRVVLNTTRTFVSHRLHSHMEVPPKAIRHLEINRKFKIRQMEFPPLGGFVGSPFARRK